MSARRPFVRPMAGWWQKNPYYVRYMIRESTSVFVTIYAFILLAGLVQLAAGETAYNAWLTVMTNPLLVLFHIIALAAALYHTITWFGVAPKVAPPVYVGGKRIPAGMITIGHYVIAVAVYLLLFIIIAGT